ncbi:MAG: DRTGG domain-containing protein [Bacteroidales bacterium]
MKITDIIEKLNLEVFSGQAGLENEIDGGYVSDLLSDVMGNAKQGQVWITLQNHKNSLAVASLKDLSAIILVKGIKPGEDTISKSEEEGIPLLGSGEDTFTVAGKLYSLIAE